MSRQNHIKAEIVGKAFRIVHCEGALDSLEEVLKKVPIQKRESWLRGVKMQLQRLADGERLSAEHFPTEGKLPRKVGQQKDKHFKAIKRKPIRGYLWRSDKFPNRYYVSHYVYKDFAKLKDKDVGLVERNWRTIEDSKNE